MIVVHTTVPIDPDAEDAEEELLAAVEDLVERSRGEEGTVGYWATRDLTDPTLLRFVERYEDTAAAEAHAESVAYRRFVEALPAAVDGDIETVQFEIEDATVAAFTAEEAVAALD